MKTNIKKSLVLELEEDEIKFLRNLTQNYVGEGLETLKENALRLKFFVATSKALGYDMNEDGSSNRLASPKE